MGGLLMSSMTVLIKPASSRCNLKCQYCFYEDESQRRCTSDYGLMSVERLEVVIQKTLSYATDSCHFLFQGGEPTLVGLKFYKKVIEFQHQYNVHQLTITNSIQTNGVLMDQSWAQFFKKNEFLVGLSLDGTKLTHDQYRKNHNGQGSFHQAILAAHLLKQYKVPFNILTVITEELVSNIEEVYAFYKVQEFMYLQFIPCLDSLASGDRYLSTESYGQFLKKLFHLWVVDLQQGRYVSIRYFDDLIQMLCHQYPNACGMLGRCGNHYVIEANGNVYPCDFYVLDQYELGNLVEIDWDIIEEKRIKSRFNEAILHKPQKCSKCKWYRLCYGGCRREREPVINEQCSINQYCEAYESFLTEAYPVLQQVANLVKNKIEY